MRDVARSLFIVLVSGFCLTFFAPAKGAQAATCDISSDTVVDQAYVDSGSCSAINISGPVSTTWVGTVDLQGAGTVTVVSGTMTMGSSSQMILGSTDDFVVSSGATVTHLAEDPYGVQVTARNITVTGSINAAAKGCRSVSGGNGFGPDSSTGVCATATSGYGKPGRGGGAHGGTGGTGGSESTAQTTLYDDAANPVLLGSGGGGGGGFGGGYIKLTASGTLTVDGTLSVNGGAGTAGDSFGNGGGSGGTVQLIAATVAGSGSVSANGGAGGSGGSGGAGAGGGGGRVAVHYGLLSGFSPTQVTTTGGVSPGGFGATSGGAGSVYFLDRVTDDGVGSLRLRGAFDFPPGDYIRDSITVDAGTALSCGTVGTLSLEASVIRMSGTTWTCSAAMTNVSVTGTSAFYATSTAWTFSNTTKVVLTGTAIFDPSSSTLTVSKIASQTWLNLPTTQTLTSFSFVGAANPGTASAQGGRLFLTDGMALTLVGSSLSASVVSSTFSVLSLDGTSSLSASGRGCQGGTTSNGYGPDLTSGETAGVCTITTAGYGRFGRGGAAHGGTGGTGGSESTAQTTTYGDPTFPILFGSGGAQDNASSPGTGNGGGILRLVVLGTFTNDGSLLVDGAIGGACDSFGCGGGSGGSLYVNAGAIAGSGSFYARGGNGAVAGAGGGGGGGRIALLYGGGSTSTMTWAATGGTTPGGFGSTAGSAGSLYSIVTNQSPNDPTSLAPMALVNGSTTGTNNPTFAFSLTDPDVADTVRYRIQIDDSADFGSPVVDFTSALAAQGTQSFQVGQATLGGSYSVGSVSQNLSDGAYYWRVRGIDPSSAVSGYATSNSGEVAFIVDTAVRTVQFQQSTASGLESLTSTSVKLVLNTTHFEDVTVNYSVTGGTATGGGVDYTLAVGTATISAGQTSTTIALTVINDAIDELAETLVITLSSPVYASLGSNTTHTYTITDNDTAGVNVSKTTAAVTEGGATDSYTIVLTSQPTSTVQIAFATSTYGVTLDAPFLSFTSGNWDTPQTVVVTATNDAIAEGTDTDVVFHTASVPAGFAYGYAGILISNVTTTITDNDTAGVNLSKTTAAVTEGGATDSYTIALTSQPTSTVRVSFSSLSSEVTLDAPFLSFTSGNWSIPQTVLVTAVDDMIAEGTHTDTVTHTASVPSGYAYGYAGVSISDLLATITDNDTAGVTISKSTATVVENGSTDRYSVVLNSAPTTTVTIAIAANDQVILSPSSLSFSSGNWSIPQEVEVAAVDDSVYEGDQSATITHVASSLGLGYTPVLSIGSVSVRVIDNESAGGGAAGAAVGIPIPVVIPNTLPIPDGETNKASESVIPVPEPSAPIMPQLNDKDVQRLSVPLQQDVRSFGITTTAQAMRDQANFIQFGSDQITAKIGEGERRAIFRDLLDVQRRMPTIADQERVASAQIPLGRNLSQEKRLAPRALQTFKTIFGHAPVFSNAKENLIWNTFMYRIRFPRDLVKEKRGIVLFRDLFKQEPKDPFQWAVVRALGYVK